MNRQTAKITRCTVPCMTVVCPVPSDNVATMIDNVNRTVHLTSMPSESVHPVTDETMATAGIVTPILAKLSPMQG